MRCAITNGRFDPHAGPEVTARLLERCAQLAAEGVDLLIVREKHLDAGEQVALTAAIVHAAKGAKVLVAGGRADVALAAGAAGVHLSAASGELTPAQVRRLMPQAFITLSCHSVEQVRSALAADAVLFGPVFGKIVDGQVVVPGKGLAALAEACRAQIPVLALGGVDFGNAPACIAAGAAGVAAIRMFFDEAGDV